MLRKWKVRLKPYCQKTNLGSEKTFDNVNWSEMFKMLKREDTEYTERRLLFKLYQKETIVIRFGEIEEKACIRKGARQGCTLLPSEHSGGNIHNWRKNKFGYKDEWQEN